MAVELVLYRKVIMTSLNVLFRKAVQFPSYLGGQIPWIDNNRRIVRVPLEEASGNYQ